MSKTMICNLKKLMDEQEINIAQLSREIGVTENAIRGYAKNSFSRIDVNTATKLCDFFKVNVGDMFDLVEER